MTFLDIALLFNGAMWSLAAIVWMSNVLLRGGIPPRLVDRHGRVIPRRSR